MKIVNRILKSSKLIDFIASCILSFIGMFFKKSKAPIPKSSNCKSINTQVEKTGVYTALLLLVIFLLIVLLVPSLIVFYKLGIPASYFFGILAFVMILTLILGTKNQVGEKSKNHEMSSFLYKAYDLDIYIAIFIAWIVI